MKQPFRAERGYLRGNREFLRGWSGFERFMLCAVAVALVFVVAGGTIYSVRVSRARARVAAMLARSGEDRRLSEAIAAGKAGTPGGPAFAETDRIPGILELKGGLDLGSLRVKSAKPVGAVTVLTLSILPAPSGDAAADASFRQELVSKEAELRRVAAEIVRAAPFPAACDEAMKRDMLKAMNAKLSLGRLSGLVVPEFFPLEP